MDDDRDDGKLVIEEGNEDEIELGNDEATDEIVDGRDESDD